MGGEGSSRGFATTTVSTTYPYKDNVYLSACCHGGKAPTNDSSCLLQAEWALQKVTTQQQTTRRRAHYRLYDETMHHLKRNSINS